MPSHEAIFAFIDREHSGGNGRPADAVKAIAAGDEVAVDVALGVLATEADSGRGGIEIVNADGGCFKDDQARGTEAGFDQIFDHLLLAVHGDGASDEFGEIDAMAAVAETELDAVVNEAFTLEACAYTGFDEKGGARVFQHTGADSALNVRAAAILYHHGFDALEVKKVREEQTGGSCADDADLGANARGQRGGHDAVSGFRMIADSRKICNISFAGGSDCTRRGKGLC